jgi:hypothetical protein
MAVGAVASPLARFLALSLGTFQVADSWSKKCLHEEVPMTPAEQFRKHAVECGHMANFLHDRQNTVAWNTIAERWLKLADWYESRVALADEIKRAKAHKKSLLQPTTLEA